MLSDRLEPQLAFSCTLGTPAGAGHVPAGSHDSMRALPCRSVLCHSPIWWQSPSTGQIHVTRVLCDGRLRVRPSHGAANVASPRRRDSQVPIRPPPRASLQPLSILSAECTLGARTLVGTEDTVLHVLLSAGCWSRPCGPLHTQPPKPGTTCHLPGRAGCGLAPTLGTACLPFLCRRSLAAVPHPVATCPSLLPVWGSRAIVGMSRHRVLWVTLTLRGNRSGLPRDGLQGCVTQRDSRPACPVRLWAVFPGGTVWGAGSRFSRRGTFQQRLPHSRLCGL